MPVQHAIVFQIGVPIRFTYKASRSLNKSGAAFQTQVDDFTFSGMQSAFVHKSHITAAGIVHMRIYKNVWSNTVFIGCKYDPHKQSLPIRIGKNMFFNSILVFLVGIDDPVSQRKRPTRAVSMQIFYLAVCIAALFIKEAAARDQELQILNLGLVNPSKSRFGDDTIGDGKPYF